MDFSKEDDLQAMLTSPGAIEFWQEISSSFDSNRRLERLIIDAPTEASNHMPRIRTILRKIRNADEQYTGLGDKVDSSVYLDIKPRTGLENLEVQTRQAAWGLPVLTGLWGDAKTEGELTRIFYMFFEQPLQIHSYSGDSQTQKTDVERLQVDRFCTDWLLKTGDSPYDSYQPGGDPPDFVCTDRHQLIPLECTKFSVQERRAAHAFLGRTRDFVLNEVSKNRRDFAQLRGLNVFLRFGEGEGKGGYPPRPDAEAQLTHILDKLREYGRGTPLLEDYEGATRQDENPKVEFVFAGHMQASRFSDGLPETSFFTRTGFELALKFQTVHTYESAWSELQALIHRKDRPENEDLLVSVGMPNEQGLVFLSEELIAEIALGAGEQLAPLQHLKRVFVHFWSSKRIVQLWPKRGELAPHGFAFDLVPSYSKPRLPF